MTANIFDFEPEMKAFLVEKGITVPIYLQKFPQDGVSKSVMVKAGALVPPLPVEVPINSQLMKISVRDTHPKDALDRAIIITNFLHGITPGKFHATSTLFMMSILMAEQPTREDDDDIDLKIFANTFVLRARPLI